ncbi:heterokaryon incompatibility protein-domain-containing protein [Boeremia exigua]|uniref:heterokaryon incompatibility protein-domain-containing protein n=1 Tax=Boeremia exigua TaxID=749465 RepID=UPI001E8CE4E3|nr:heterokaryon incompatibility protein-domain-containing protein [Boeremia exigua]KAH6619004.1 heterokaryon incompatibility protein-domain-containing protein [Boeremia exigua]
MQAILDRVDNLTKRDVNSLRAFMLHDPKRAWLEHKRRLVRKTGVNILAKLWIRSERLRKLKALYLKRALSPTAKMYKRDLARGQIRLLHIKPGNSLSTIECAFTFMDLPKNGDYVALSYTWGTAVPSIPIMVNGTVTMVTDNLYMALLHLRKGKVPRVWVDALCINQNNMTERSTQVSQMAEVYRGASMVYVWLGESNEMTRRAFEELYKMTQHVGWDNKIPAAYFDTNQAHPEWVSMCELLYRPWFRRVWIIQEILSARHALFVCGADFLEANTFLTIINSMLEAKVLSKILSFHANKSELVNGTKTTTSRQLEFIVQARNRSVNPLTMMDFRGSLLDYLSQTRWAEATNPRDKIYGILSLAKDASNLGWYEENRPSRRLRSHRVDHKPWAWVPFTVDYAVSPVRVFTNVTRAIIYKTKSIEVLKFVDNGTARLTELPSWVPNWGDSSPPRTYHIPFDYERQPRSSEGPKVWRPSKRNDFSNARLDRTRRMISNCITEHCSAVFSFGPDDTLTLKGLEFDKITALSTDIHPPVIDLSKEPNIGELCAIKDYFLRLKQWIEQCVQLCECHEPFPTLEETWTVFKEVLYEGKVEEGVKPVPGGFDDLLTDLTKAIDALAIEIRVHQLGDDEPLLDVLRTTANVQYEAGLLFQRLPSASLFSSDRRLAITAKKRMGLVPKDSNVGDAVCVMYGSELPFILRYCGRRKFKFIGCGKFEGFDFDDAVIDRTYTLRSWEDPDCEDGIVMWVTAKRRVCIVLKRASTFCLV